MNEIFEKKIRRLPFIGAASAMITPFDEEGKVDYYTLEKLINRQISYNMDGIVMLGTTAETPTVNDTERSEILSLAASLCKNKIKMIVGSGSNDAEKAVKQTKEAVKYGADAILAVTPYYNKCNNDGLIKYYKKIALASQGVPVILYNVPSRTGVEITPDVAARLAEIPEIVAFKEAGNDFSKSLELLNMHTLPVFSGNDDRTLPLLCCGAVGTVSVVSNLLPTAVRDICIEHRSSNLASALELHNRYYPLTKAIFSEVNPIGIKYAMHLCGLCGYKTRLPLGEVSDSCKFRIKKELENLEMI